MDIVSVLLPDIGRCLIYVVSRTAVKKNYSTKLLILMNLNIPISGSSTETMSIIIYFHTNICIIHEYESHIVILHVLLLLQGT